MAPPLPPGLMDDLIGEILLRLPPSDPACLVRASLVCKRWRSLVLDRAFLRQYRVFHRTAPVLGFFHDQQCGYADDIFVHRFVATTTMQAPPSLPQPAASAGPSGSAAKGKQYSCRTLDCRHGRVLFHTVTVLWPSSTLTVWDPVTGDHKSFPPPSDIDPYYEFTGAVLCASAAASDGGGGGHLECSGGGPFLVVIAGVDHGEDYDEDGVAWARVYSSETAAWGEATTLDVESFVDPAQPSLLVEGAVYFMVEFGRRILKYDCPVGDEGAAAPWTWRPRHHLRRGTGWRAGSRHRGGLQLVPVDVGRWRWRVGTWQGHRA